MNFLFAWRYFKAKKSTNAINVIAWVSIVAIVVGTALQILVLSVYNGFEGLVKDLYSTFYTDIKISPVKGKTITLTPAQLQQIRSIPQVRIFSRVVEEKALVRNGDFQSIVQLKGVDDDYRYTTGVADHIVNGNYDIGNDEIPKLILGAGVEGALGIRADRNIFTLTIHLPRKTETEQMDLVEGITNDTIRSAAAFVIQQDFDNKYGITNLDFVKRSLGMGPDEYSGLEISLHDPNDASRVKRKLKSMLGERYLVQNRYEQNRSLYSIMNVERWVIYGVLCLILVVAAFNMIGALTMLVLEKKKDISVLQSLGANQSFIRRIFLSEGLLLAVIGGGTGMLMALLLVFLQLQFHLVPLNGGFLIDYYPVSLRLRDFLLVGGTVVLIAVIASWFPARKAAAEEFTLRSE